MTSPWQVVKEDLEATIEFTEQAWLAAAQLLEASKAAATTFERVAPHVSSNPAFQHAAEEIKKLVSLAEQAYVTAPTCYHAADDANRSFT
ncbi:hypothetical protein [Amycolatopsis sp. NPDC059021]|uniref:hypothetical protein n=1 Tax=Amycolatopsis sp. NPDC059021 TaxID=3346704 RepID=UPI00366B0229